MHHSKACQQLQEIIGLLACVPEVVGYEYELGQIQYHFAYLMRQLSCNRGEVSVSSYNGLIAAMAEIDDPVENKTQIQIDTGPGKYLDIVREIYDNVKMVDSSYADVAYYTYWVCSNDPGPHYSTNVVAASYMDGDFRWRTGFGPDAPKAQEQKFDYPDPSFVFETIIKTKYPNAWSSGTALSNIIPVIFWIDLDEKDRTAMIARYQNGILTWNEDYIPDNTEQHQDLRIGVAV